jgi:hypothetical protein
MVYYGFYPDGSCYFQFIEYFTMDASTDVSNWMVPGMWTE